MHRTSCSGSTKTLANIRTKKVTYPFGGPRFFMQRGIRKALQRSRRGGFSTFAASTYVHSSRYDMQFEHRFPGIWAPSPIRKGKQSDMSHQLKPQMPRRET